MWNEDHEAAERFLRHYQSPRGLVRIQLVARHVTEHLPPGPAHLVDIGAGGGQQAAALAREGHRVTLVEPSPLMLARAEETIAGLPEEVRGRMSLHRMSAQEAADRLPAAGYDGVLCHGVLMYLPSPGPLLRSLAQLCAPGGLVSVVTKNAAALAFRPALQGDYAEALNGFGARTSTGWLGAPTRGDTVEDLTVGLREYGVCVRDWYGVGVFSDHRTDLEDLPDDQLRLLQAVEYEAARRDPYRATARLIHVVGHRPSARSDPPALPG
ncbi:methyltransferase [Streptomyces iconiensis]|uniref:Methyltransferase domain-containing protein n=1 Tax=Streptomyces iconiensis TaxID=1384038 RepID=A0ABT6ZZF8_9ACTN|nr:methyltransferase [Streptomyces iconiensis]MDJ1134465.1 methyltransferase domain-containing protein [Streptomyces iconiensis]